MKLDALRLGLAAAIVTAVLWGLGRGMMLLAMPGYPAWASGHMMRGGYGYMGHAQFHAFGWAGFAIGFVFWPLIAGLAAWATAALYNRLLPGRETDSSKSSD